MVREIRPPSFEEISRLVELARSGPRKLRRID
jgi:hypothetical protein